MYIEMTDIVQSLNKLYPAKEQFTNIDEIIDTISIKSLQFHDIVVHLLHSWASVHCGEKKVFSDVRS